MSRVVHFEIPADNPERVAGFYKKVLGWDIQKWEGPVDYWLISTGKETEPGIHGGIARKKDRSASGILVTAQVDSVDDCLKKIAQPGAASLSRNGRFLVWATRHISVTLKEMALDFDSVRNRKR
jgi:predicted enzyme related to lactoylglutathione lyase